MPTQPKSPVTDDGWKVLELLSAGRGAFAGVGRSGKWGRESVLRGLRRRGLVAYGGPAVGYSITEAGRAALAIRASKADGCPS